MTAKERKTLSKQSKYWRKKRKQMRINDSKMFSFRIKEFTVLKPEKSDTDAQWKTFRTSREREEKKCSQRSMYLCWKRYYFAFHWHLRRLNRKVCCRMNEIPKSNKRPRWNKFTNKKNHKQIKAHSTNEYSQALWRSPFGNSNYYYYYYDLRSVCERRLVIIRVNWNE